jgi:Tol biopolymer transport system component/DNA-binding winged helix-turn-helix (wHTH) protein
MTASESPRIYDFGRFRLDPTERLLLRDGEAVALTPKAFDLLVCLVERHGRLVEKRTLMALLWPDAVVEEANIAYTVSAVRKALGVAAGERFIETVPTLGYRFAAPVVTRAKEDAGRSWPAPLRPTTSIALASAGLVVAAGLLVWRAGRPERHAGNVTRFEVAAPSDYRRLSPPALSPDGRRVVYASGGAQGQKLYMRSLDRTEATPLAGTDIARAPFFSPDGTTVGFFAADTIRTVALSTGNVTTVCRTDRLVPEAATWGRDDRIYFGPAGHSGISFVSTAGGAPQELTAAAPGEIGHSWPELLPDGRHLLFTSAGAWDSYQERIEAVSLRDGKRQVLLQGARAARYLPSGHLVFARGDALVVVAFDPGTLRITGREVKVLDGVAVPAAQATALFDLSEDGTLAYFSGSVFSWRTDLVWTSAGRREALKAPHAFYLDPAVSPDGRHVAVAAIRGRQNGVWVGDLARGTWTRLTAEATNAGGAVWRRDIAGEILLYLVRPSRRVADLFSLPADGSGPPRLVYQSRYHKFATSSSAQGLVAFVEVRPDTKADVWLMEFGPRVEVRPFLQTPFWESSPALSPDGRWLAYECDESGRSEVYVRPVAAVGGKTQVSIDGGDRPRWSPDGRGVVFRRGSQMMKADVAAGSSFAAGKPRVLVEGTFESGGFVVPNYDVSPDGRRLLMIEPPRDSELPNRIVVVENWLAEVRGMVAAR